MTYRAVQPTAAHQAFYDAVLAAAKTHLPNEPLTVLAILSQIVGRVVAMQDQTKVSPALAMEVVSVNLEAGNRQMLDSLGKTDGPMQ
jgi:hypothetical protein